MSAIAKDAKLITLINVLTVALERQHELKSFQQAILR
jgi:hypothetical protein